MAFFPLSLEYVLRPKDAVINWVLRWLCVESMLGTDNSVCCVLDAPYSSNTGHLDTFRTITPH